MLRRGVFIGLWAFMLVACGSTTPPEPQACGSSTCEGCCTADGRCSRGLKASACGVGGQACVDCGAEGQCGLDGRCTAAVPDGGTRPDAGTPPPPCGATALTLGDGGVVQVSGTTLGAERRAIGSCGGVDGSEAFYAFTLASSVPSGTDVVITVTPRDAAFQPVVYLRQGAACDSSQSELGQACIAAHQPGATVQLHTRLSSPGSGPYFVVVDGLSATGGAFDLSVEVGGRTASSCADVLPLPGRQFTVRSTYSGAGDSLTPSCGSSGSGDRVYRLETGEPAYLRARVEDANGVYKSALVVADLCGGQERTCSSRLDSVLLSAGTHYLWLDRYVQSFEGSGYTLRAELTAPLPGDACAQARPLVFSNGAQGGTATHTVAAAGLHNDGNWACGWPSGLDADLVYSFTTDRPLALRATATESMGRPLALTLVRAACTPESRVACASPTLDVTNLPAGSYYLWVDGIQEDSGDVSLSASLDPP